MMKLVSNIQFGIISIYKAPWKPISDFITNFATYLFACN